MRCSICGRNAPTCYVEFYENIGALVTRFSKQVRGNLCRRCINRTFFKFTLTTMLVGWFGLISLVLTPLFIINNIARYIATLGLKHGNAPTKVADEHPTRSLTADAVTRLEAFRTELGTRLAGGEELDRVCAQVGPRAGVSAFQVELYIIESNMHMHRVEHESDLT